MAGNDYNVAIKPMDTAYVVDSMAINNPMLQTQLPLLNFGTEINQTIVQPQTTSMDMFNNIVANLKKQLDSMRYVLMPPQTQLAPLNIPGTGTVKQDRTTNIDAGQAFDAIMEYVFKDEGGYVNHPKDPGGATNMGVTQRTYDWYCELNKISSKNVKDLTKEEAKQVYHQLFWEKSGAKEIAENGNAELAYVVFDTAIHSGVARAKKLLAKSGGDAEKMLENRLAFLQGLKNWSTFGRGWTARIDKIESRIDNLGGQKEYLA